MRGSTPRVSAQCVFSCFMHPPRSVRIWAVFYNQMEITKTDLKKAIAYLDDAAKLYAAMPKPKHQWRAAQIRQLTAKLKSKTGNNGTK